MSVPLRRNPPRPPTDRWRQESRRYHLSSSSMDPMIGYPSHSPTITNHAVHSHPGSQRSQSELLGVLESPRTRAWHRGTDQTEPTTTVKQPPLYSLYPIQNYTALSYFVYPPSRPVLRTPASRTQPRLVPNQVLFDHVLHDVYGSPIAQ
jgi:hypothetical protein